MTIDIGIQEPQVLQYLLGEASLTHAGTPTLRKLGLKFPLKCP